MKFLVLELPDEEHAFATHIYRSTGNLEQRVVRCDKCVHFGLVTDDGPLSCLNPDGGLEVEGLYPDDFCSRFERR